MLIYGSASGAGFDWRVLEFGHLWWDMVRGFSTEFSWTWALHFWKSSGVKSRSCPCPLVPREAGQNFGSSWLEVRILSSAHASAVWLPGLVCCLMMIPGLDNLAAHPPQQESRPFLSSCSAFIRCWLCPQKCVLPFQYECHISRHRIFTHQCLTDLSVSSGLHFTLLLSPALLVLLCLSSSITAKCWERFLGMQSQWFLVESPEQILYPCVSWLDKWLSYKYPLVMWEFSERLGFDEFLEFCNALMELSVTGQ